MRTGLFRRYLKLWLPIILGANIITASAFVMVIHEKSRTTKAVILSLKTENAVLRQSVAQKDAEISALTALINEQNKYLDLKLPNKTGHKK